MLMDKECPAAWHRNKRHIIQRNRHKQTCEEVPEAQNSVYCGTNGGKSLYREKCTETLS
jgi:hypothetical protein